jgi:hypothetical protein
VVVLLGEWCAWAPVLQGSRHVWIEQRLEDMAERVQHVVRDGRAWRRAPRPISSPCALYCTAAGFHFACE